jgi:hypothetical protein
LTEGGSEEASTATSASGRGSAALSSGAVEDSTAAVEKRWAAVGMVVLVVVEVCGVKE